MATIDASNRKWHSYVRDAATALKITLSSSKDKLLRDWIFVPVGVFAILAACYGVDVLFRTVSVSFPASVACLALLFVGLLLSEVLLGTHLTRRIVNVINVPADWCLRWIGLFFTPSFVTIPLSPPISIAEVFKMIAVFVIGFAIMMLVAAYMTRGLQMLLGSSKRSEAQRAEEMHRQDADDIPLHSESSVSEISSPPQLRLQHHHHHHHLGSSSSQDTTAGSGSGSGSAAFAPSSSSSSSSLTLPAYPAQSPPPPARCALYAAKLTTHLDTVLFTVLLLGGIPVFFATKCKYPMPLHLAVTTLCYKLALGTPSPWKQYLHPVLTSSLLTVLVIWPLSLANRTNLLPALQTYRTGANYIHIWQRPVSPSPSPSTSPAPVLPGAGDVFASILDASIVSLALPMFQYRRELKRHFLTLLVPNVLVSVGSVFSYPVVCYAIGIDARRSLAFASRSLTLALAAPATRNLGGDSYTIAALAIASGILGVLVAERVMKVLRIPEDDYVTRGITLGINSSAIGTALLLRTDPRAAALSSLSMTLFGTITVLLTSIPPVASIIRGLVGL